MHRHAGRLEPHLQGISQSSLPPQPWSSSYTVAYLGLSHTQQLTSKALVYLTHNSLPPQPYLPLRFKMLILGRAEVTTVWQLSSPVA